MALRSIRAFNCNFDVVVERRASKLHLIVMEEGHAVADRDLADGGSVSIKLP